MVDRYVAFIYTGSFSMDKKGKATHLHHATKFLAGKTAVDFAMSIDTPVHFYLSMYGMGERLQDTSLMDLAHTKMAEGLLFESAMPPGLVIQIVGWVYGTTQRICQDEKRELRNLVAICVLRYVRLKLWTVEQVNVFTTAMAPYGVFVADLDSASGLHEELEKTWSRGKKRGHDGGQASKKQAT